MKNSDRSLSASLPELLSPAGAEDSLHAALAGGADAVYFGGRSFSNRMRAKNFTDYDLTRAIALTHDAGAKAYVTINTRIREREMSDVLSLCEVILNPKESCDAIICADLGLAREIRRHFPNAVLHGSTQTSCSSPADCEQLAKLGFSRLVIPRELSKNEIKKLCSDTSMEIEMFLHGAHCVSLSGQCLMSYFIGGRSGNRGECAQPCRLPWNGTNSYPLSLADMCLAGKMTDVISSGVCSLKIEGRLKTPSYVYGVTKIYRTLLDEQRNATQAEIKALSDLFTRGFTDGYFSAKYYTMSGTKASDKNTLIPTEKIKKELDLRLKNEKERKKTAIENAKTAISGSFSMKVGEKLTLTLVCGSTSVTVNGDVPQPATGKPADVSSVKKNLTKFGSTGFTLATDALECTIDDGLWVPISSLNDLRRRASDTLEEKLAKEKSSENVQSEVEMADIATKAEEKSRKISAKSVKQEKTAEFLDITPLLNAQKSDVSEIFDKFDRIYFEWSDVSDIISLYGSEKICAVMPPLEPSSEKTDEIIREMKKLGIKRIMAHTLGQVSQILDCGMEADISFRGNITNTAAMRVYEDIGCSGIYLSAELPPVAVSAMHGGASVYGKLPAMTMSKCVICQASAQKKCQRGNLGGRNNNAKKHRCKAVLTDRMGAKFSVFSLGDCENVICNSQPYWMGDKMNFLNGASILHYFFTDEAVCDIKEIIRKYENGEKGEGRRLG